MPLKTLQVLLLFSLNSTVSLFLKFIVSNIHIVLLNVICVIVFSRLVYSNMMKRSRHEAPDSGDTAGGNVAAGNIKKEITVNEITGDALITPVSAESAACYNQIRRMSRMKVMFFWGVFGFFILAFLIPLGISFSNYDIFEGVFGLYYFAPLLGVFIIFMLYVIISYIFYLSGIKKFSRRLTVLRVFGLKSNTRHLFNRVVHFWNYAGPSFTIMDPIFAKSEFSFWGSPKNFRLKSAQVFAIFAGAVIGYKVNSGGMALSYILMILSSVIINVILLYIIIPTFFIKKSDALHKRIGRTSGRDRGWYGIGKQVNLYCFDNIWKKALGRIVEGADAVIMDLRGFSADRKGCAFEMSHLVNNYDLDRALFIVDGGTDKNLFIETLREEARRLGADSPNAGKENINVTVFSCDGQGRKNTGKIMQILCNMTSPVQAPGSDVSSPSFMAGAPFVRFSSFFIAVMLVIELLEITSVSAYLVTKTVRENAFMQEQDIVVAPPPEALTSFDLPEFSSATADEEPHFLKMQVTLGYDANPDLGRELQTRKDEMTYIINVILRGKTCEDLNSTDDMLRFSEEIKAELNARLETGKIKEVYFREFILN